MDPQLPEFFEIRLLRSTPFPNRLMELGATLPETPARLLYHIIRQTLGWQGPSRGQRKASMTTSVGQLRKQIARNSTLAVAEGLAALVRLEVIDVTGELGNPIPFRDLASSQRRKIRITLVPRWVEE